VRQQGARILARLEPHGGGVALAEECVERDAGLLVRGIVTEAEGLGHLSPPS
jgi:hypothetical protein